MSTLTTKNELLDIVEQSCVGHIVALLKHSGQTVSKEQARSLLSKVGARIVFGKEVFNATLRS